MSKVEVIVAAMNQNCEELYHKMNAQCDMLIANQTDHYDYEEHTMNGNTVRMISTATRGVGINRNLGLQMSRGDILLLSDEDVIYHDDYVRIIEKAFDQLPDADIIAFQLKYVAYGKELWTDQFSTGKKHIWNGLSFGAAKLAIRKDAILRENIHFTNLFGGGCKYSCGEDSKFLVECYRSGIKVYSYGETIGTTIKEESSWFTGFHEKYFYDRGALAAAAFSWWMQLPIILYYTYQYRKRDKGNLSLFKKIHLMMMGRKGYKELKSYDDIYG